jgi:SPP1 gp7 family putative phage head morphogenesis protein
MNKWERQVTRYLNDSEHQLLVEYDRWLKAAFSHIPLGANEHAIHGFHLTHHQRLSSILFKHSATVFTAGQAHGEEDCQNILKKKKRRLAKYPGIDLEQADDDDPFTPHDAIKVLQQRSIVLAGEVENDITSGIKEILLRNLAGLPRQRAEEQIAELLEHNMNRASLIVTTETTYAYNRGRLFSYRENGADYVRYMAIMDARTCQICGSRNGKILSMDDLGSNIPPVHGRCRCVLSPIFSDVQPDLITKQALDWSSVKPLPRGWVN